MEMMQYLIQIHHLCNAPHINEFELGRKVALDYVEDLSLPILDPDRKEKERQIGSSTMYSVHCTITCVDLIILFYNIIFCACNVFFWRGGVDIDYFILIRWRYCITHSNI